MDIEFAKEELRKLFRVADEAFAKQAASWAVWNRQNDMKNRGEISCVDELVSNNADGDYTDYLDATIGKWEEISGHVNALLVPSKPSMHAVQPLRIKEIQAELAGVVWQS